MQIQRNYSEPFFRERKRRVGCFRQLLLGVAVVAIVIFVGYTQLDQIILTATGLFEAAPTPTALPSQLATDGAAQLQVGNLTEAVELFEAAVKQRPDNVDYLYEYGQILIDLDRPQEAETVADRMIDLSPNDARGYALKTRALVWQSNPASAIAIGLTGIEIDPNFAPLYAALARAYTNTGRWGDGLEYGAVAVELEPSNLHTHWAYAHSLTSVGEYERAEEHLSLAIGVNPNFIPPYFELAFLYLASDRDQDAIDMYDRILSLDAFNARAHLRLCEAYAKTGQFDRAIGYCRDSVVYDSSEIRAHFQLGMLTYRQRQFADAQEAFCWVYSD